MQELVLNPVTVGLLLAIASCVALAVRRLVRRGLCDCNDHCDAGCGGCSGCPHGADGAGRGSQGGCAAAEGMVARAGHAAAKG